MNALGFAWLSLVRQPARAALGVLGVAAVGALLFDMLLLSQGLVTSMRDLFERAGFDLRITATDALPGQGPRVMEAGDALAAISANPSVGAAVALRLAAVTLQNASGTELRATLQGVRGTGVFPWNVTSGRDIRTDDDLLMSEAAATRLGVKPGDRITLWASCDEHREALPAVQLTVSGVAAFPFETTVNASVAASMHALESACGFNDLDTADFIMAATRDGADRRATAAAIAAAVPSLRVLTNEDIVGRLEGGGFSYFRQISTVLTTVTLAFAVLLITVLLTVSVNQRLGEIAALRALGFSRWRVVADVLCESALIVGGGGLLSLPLGGLLAVGLDSILKNIPGIPTDVHFFAFEWNAVAMQVALLVATALVAALYPMKVVAGLPIAATLRNEVVG